jgi:hypothetical protein
LWNRWVPNRTFAVPKDYYNLGVSNLSFEPHKEHLVSLLIVGISDGRSSPASDTTPGMIFLNTCKTRYETTNSIYMHSAKLRLLNVPHYKTRIKVLHANFRIILKKLVRINQLAFRG